MDEKSSDLQLKGKYNYENVKRWKSCLNTDIFAKDKIYIPINEGDQHWILVVVDVKNKVIQHYNSLHKQKKKKEDPIEYYTMAESYDIAAEWNMSRKKKLEIVLRY